jgi:hypothetical protein
MGPSYFCLIELKENDKSEEIQPITALFLQRIYALRTFTVKKIKAFQISKQTVRRLSKIQLMIICPKHKIKK